MVDRKKDIFGKTSIFIRVTYEIFSSLGLIYRSIRYPTTYFLDTNFVVTKESKFDKRYKKLFLVSRNFFVTESINDEVEDKLKANVFRKINNSKLKVVSFNDLHKIRPICPAYYNFISTMHNPANISSPDFYLQVIFSRIIKKRKLTKDEDRLHMLAMTKLIDDFKKEMNPAGSKKTEFEEVIEEAHMRSLKKRKDAHKGKNKNYANDLRNMATIFSYALLKKRNVVFLTADSDAVAYFFDWSASIIQQMSFSVKCLEELNKDDRAGMKALFAGKRESMYFKYDEMARFITGTLQRFYSDRKKYLSPRLSVKYWDKKRQKYFEIGVNIDWATREFLLCLHGSLNCPSTRNDSMGSFIGYQYWWPPASREDANTLKILPRLKPIRRESIAFPPEIHDHVCKYRKHDLTDDFEFFSSFN